MNDILMIGIAGGTGSGKTTITEKIMERFGNNVTVLKHDNYYKAHDSLTYEERSKLNYDHPSSFDTDLLIEHIKLLKEGRDIICPVYDYTVHNRSKDTITISPNKVMIVEGILIFENLELCKLFDIKLFVDADADVRILRRINRDVKERGRSLDSIISQYLTTVKPMHEAFVEPSKKNADLIIPEGGHNEVAIDVILRKIEQHLLS
ncbi:MAG: uridine kinase [Lachnospiraceae bacterium]|nr:uridine kinase [Lachnospiraceae bacterium]